MQQLIQCNRCGVDNNPGQQYCWNCQQALLLICSNCGTSNNLNSISCSYCYQSFHQLDETRLPFQNTINNLQQTQVLGQQKECSNSTWTWIIYIVLFVIIAILGVFLWNTSTELSKTKATLVDTQNQLDVTKQQLASTKNELDNTKSQLISTKNELDNTKGQLAIALNELQNIKGGGSGQTNEANKTLEVFLASAIGGNYDRMWNMLHPDSQRYYTDADDFASNNSVAQKNGYYLLSQYNIGSGKILTSWNGYSNAAEVKVVLIRNKNSLASLVLSWIPVIGTLESFMPSMETAKWDAHLVKVGNDWKVFCEKKPSSSSSTK